MTTQGEILRLDVNYSIPGSSLAQNVFYWRVDEATSDAEANLDMLQWVEEEWGAVWATMSDDACSISDIKTSIVNLDGTVDRVLGSLSINLAGSAGIQDTEAAAVAAGIFAPTARPKSRGRKFVPGVTKNLTSGGIFTSTLTAVLTSLVLKYVVLWAGDEGGEYTPGIISTVTETFLEFLLGGGFDDIPDYQRRRRPDRGI